MSCAPASPSRLPLRSSTSSLAARAYAQGQPTNTVLFQARLRSEAFSNPCTAARSKNKHPDSRANAGVSHRQSQSVDALSAQRCVAENQGFQQRLVGQQPAQLPGVDAPLVGQVHSPLHENGQPRRRLQKHSLGWLELTGSASTFCCHVLGGSPPPDRPRPPPGDRCNSNMC